MNAHSPRTRIVFLVSTWFGSSWYRCHVPGSALKEAGYEVEMTDAIDRSWAHECDVMVAKTLHQPEVLELVGYLKQRGALTVFDIDDDYWNLDPANPAAKAWDVQMLDTMAGIVSSVDLVTTPSRELREVVAPMNERVRVLGNMLPDENWPNAPKRLPSAGEPIVLGWAGSASHHDDVRMLGPVLLQLLDEHPDLQVRLAGIEPLDGLAHERLSYPEAVDIREYADVLAEFDIGAIPLLDTRFNRHKSDLKFVEYGMIGLPTVVSRAAPYEGIVKHDVNGLVAKNAKDWLRYLRRLIAEEDTRRRLGAAAREFAEGRLMSRNVSLWEDAYGLGAPASGPDSP